MDCLGDTHHLVVDLFDLGDPLAVPAARLHGECGPARYLKQNYEMLAERARGLLSGEVSRPDEHETRRHTI